jgi:hypothetical protein
MVEFQRNTFADSAGVTSAPEKAGVLDGSRHPLAAAAQDARQDSQSKEAMPAAAASEVISTAGGRQQETPLTGSRLAPGDHTIKFRNGREFRVHIPQGEGSRELPVLFVMADSGDTRSRNGDSPGLAAQMNQLSEKSKFVAVYPMLSESRPSSASEQRLPDSAGQAGMLNSVPAENSDPDLIKSVAGLLPEIAIVDGSHRCWGAIAFSGGGKVLSEISRSQPGLFSTVGLVETVTETKKGPAELVLNEIPSPAASLSPATEKSPSFTKEKLTVRTGNLASGSGDFAEATKQGNPVLQNSRAAKYSSLEKALDSVSNNARANSGAQDLQKQGALYIYDRPAASAAGPAVRLDTPDSANNELSARFVKVFDCLNRGGVAGSRYSSCAASLKDEFLKSAGRESNEFSMVAEPSPFAIKLANAALLEDSRMPGTGRCALAVQWALSGAGLSQFMGSGHGWGMLRPLEQSGLFRRVPEDVATVGDIIVRPPSANPYDDSVYGDISVVTSRRGDTIMQTNDATYEYRRYNPRYDGRAVFLRFLNIRG